MPSLLGREMCLKDKYISVEHVMLAMMETESKSAVVKY
ncbi:Clp protease N-terminal domain-containing protein [Clostridioides difficile]|nr:Clp protease N-terminal domain-containing protein [Clostridioides difficile]